MRKLLLLVILSFSTTLVFGQQFSQFNTETLFDSFENPSQRSFIRDSSNKYASNFFIPNFGAWAYLTGNAQRSVQSRLFDEKYDNSQLEIGRGKLNHVNANSGAYLFMFKMFSSLNGDQEIGFSIKTKAEANGVITDETVAMFNGSANFDNIAYDNIFNSKGYYQTYHQVGFSYRERLSKKVAMGFKINFLMGMEYQEILIRNSSIAFDKPGDQATLTADALYYKSENAGNFNRTTLLPSFKNPGASISIGGQYKTDDNLVWQANVKDLGFIHWGSKSTSSRISGPVTLTDLSQPWREDSVKAQLNRYIQSGRQIAGSFYTPTDAVAELALSKKYRLSYDNRLRMHPTVILQKQLFYSGFTGAFVDHLQYNNLVLTLTTSYNDLKLFNLGGQFMVKTPNVEFYLGSERLIPSTRMLSRRSGYNAPYTGADVFLGFSVKFGPQVESHMNESHIPMGEEKGFLGRFFDNIFGRGNGGGQL